MTIFQYLSYVNYQRALKELKIKDIVFFFSDSPTVILLVLHKVFDESLNLYMVHY